MAGRMPSNLIIRRTLAYLVDIAFLFGILAPAGFLIQSIVGSQPATGPEVSLRIAWNMSLPTWLYFILSDSSAGGASLGKRLLGVRSSACSGKAIAPLRALLRNAVKLLPWELAHIAGFGLSTDLSQFGWVQSLGIGLANALWIGYFLVAVANKGRRSVHDLIASTEVGRNLAV